MIYTEKLREKLLTHLQEKCKPEHLDALRDIANGAYEGSRGDVVRAFKGAGAKVSNDEDRNLKIIPPLNTNQHTIDIGSSLTIKIENKFNRLTDLAERTLNTYHEIMATGAPPPSAPTMSHDR